MAVPKRKLSSSSADEDQTSERDLDISSALVGQKRPKFDSNVEEEDDDDLNDLIQKSIAKRNVKSGTEVLKKTKGRKKIVKGEVGGGSFQSMGLHPALLRSLTLQGFRIPTPIQRASIPALLTNPPRDLVGMARTGSGKSLAYMIPLIQRLGGRHATNFGARALILLPTRELALQILKVGKELARGWNSSEGGHAGDAKDQENKKGQNLRWGLIVGGEGLDEQFEMISDNPDIIIATPGRLLHLIVEMNLDLKSVNYVVFDEADRLFEMGFEVALNEIIARLPTSRQTLLFSATLPKSLVEFAKAGLQDPKLVRLDAESKISSDLKMAFFSVKQVEKDACLLALLRDVIKVPFKPVESRPVDEESQLDKKSKSKGKQKQKYGDQLTSPHQTLVFTATKHHVEYLNTLLITAGYAVSHIYGSLDQTARSYQMDQFRRGLTSVLVVTDVAARGIDIPVLENVVNYDFPQGARVFVHRVGRTARAGRKGWAWSFITPVEMPYLLDLQLFLGRPLRNGISSGEMGSELVYTESLVLGTFERERIDEDMEYLRSLEEENHSIPVLREVMKRGQAMYERSKGKASSSSYKRAKEMMKANREGVHPVLLRSSSNWSADGGEDEEAASSIKAEREIAEKRRELLKAVGMFRPSETVFEAGTKGKNVANAALMKERRKALVKAKERAVTAPISTVVEDNDGEDNAVGEPSRAETIEMADEDEIAAVFDTSNARAGYKDPEFYMDYVKKDAMTEKGYSLTDGASFADQARVATFDLTNDEHTDRKGRPQQLNWDKKKKKFIRGDGVGADNVKLVRTENGTRLPATYRSGRFEEWKKARKVSVPKVGQMENEGGGGRRGGMRSEREGKGGKRFKHVRVEQAKSLDKSRTDYERKTRQLKKRNEGASGGDARDGGGKAGGSKGKVVAGRKGVKSGGRYGGKSIGRVRSELKSAEQIRKGRKVMDNRRAKNARPGRKSGKGRSR